MVLRRVGPTKMPWWPGTIRRPGFAEIEAASESPADEFLVHLGIELSGGLAEIGDRARLSMPKKIPKRAPSPWQTALILRRWEKSH